MPSMLSENAIQITHAISSKVNFPVDFESLAIDWNGWKPKVIVKELKIYSPNRQVEHVYIYELSITFDLFKSAYSQEWRTDEISAIGFNLAIPNLQNNFISVQKLNTEQKNILRWFFKQPKFKASKTNFLLKDKTASMNDWLTNITMESELKNESFFLAGKTVFKDNAGSQLNFELHIPQPKDSNDFRGSFFTQVSVKEQSFINSKYFSFPSRLNFKEVNLVTNTSWKNGNISATTFETQIRAKQNWSEEKELDFYFNGLIKPKLSSTQYDFSLFNFSLNNDNKKGYITGLLDIFLDPYQSKVALNDIHGIFSNASFFLQGEIIKSVKKEADIQFSGQISTTNENFIKASAKAFKEAQPYESFLQSGIIDKGYFTYTGKISNKPNLNVKKNLRIGLRISDTSIELSRKWPEFRDGEIVALFENDSLSAAVKNAQSDTLTMNKLLLSGKNLFDNTQNLTASATFTCEGDAIVSLLEKTNLNLLNEIPDLEISNPVTIKLSVNQDQQKKLRIKSGNILFKNNNIGLSRTKFSVNNLNGLVRFTNNKITSRNLRANINKLYPVKIEIDSNEKLSIKIKSQKRYYPYLVNLTLKNTNKKNKTHITINELTIYGETLKNHSLAVIKSTSHYEIKINGDAVKGKIIAPRNFKTPYTIKLLKLKLNNYSSLKNQTFGALQGLPPSNVEIDNFQLGKTKINSLKFSAIGDQSKIHFKNIFMNTDDITISGNGSWNVMDPRTTTELTVNGGSINSILNYFNYNIDNIENEKSVITLKGSWNNHPHEFALAALEGDLALTLTKGRILNIKTGSGRLFGLLSFQTLPRRLSLDFEDLIKKGLRYDVVSGDFQISARIAKTSNLTLIGPSAMITITGVTDLEDNTYDQVVTMSPKLSSSIPVASALLGGVGIGAGAVYYLAQKLFKEIPEKVDKILEKRYSIKGSWENPIIEKI